MEKYPANFEADTSRSAESRDMSESVLKQQTA